MPRIAHAVAAALCVPLLLTAAPASAAPEGADAVWATGSESPDDSYDTGRAECIGLLPQPDCGRPPEKSGDRGGWAQFVLFGLIVVAVTAIFTYVLRSVVRADRRRAADAAGSAWVTTTGGVDPPAD